MSRKLVQKGGDESRAGAGCLRLGEGDVEDERAARRRLSLPTALCLDRAAHIRNRRSERVRHTEGQRANVAQTDVRNGIDYVGSIEEQAVADGAEVEVGN